MVLQLVDWPAKLARETPRSSVCLLTPPPVVTLKASAGKMRQATRAVGRVDRDTRNFVRLASWAGFRGNNGVDRLNTSATSYDDRVSSINWELRVHFSEI